MRLVTALFVLCLSSPWVHAAADDCERELDRYVGMARAGDSTGAEDGLQALMQQCNQLPQIRHDLGSLAAGRGDWDAAIEHLEAAIALDERTADTVDSLREIQRWRAARAYAQALGEPEPTAAPPIPSLHDSRRANADSGMPCDVVLPDEDLLDRTLGSWWDSAAEGGSRDHDMHYGADFQGDRLASSTRDARRPGWESVERVIAFGREHAIALLRWSGASDIGHERLLMLQPHDGRWTIYEERAL